MHPNEHKTWDLFAGLLLNILIVAEIEYLVRKASASKDFTYSQKCHLRTARYAVTESASRSLTTGTRAGLCGSPTLGQTEPLQSQ